MYCVKNTLRGATWSNAFAVCIAIHDLTSKHFYTGDDEHFAEGVGRAERGPEARRCLAPGLPSKQIVRPGLETRRPILSPVL